MGTPYIGFSNDTLDKQPEANRGDELLCWKCGERHHLEVGTDENGESNNMLLFFRCQEKIYLGAVGGKWVVNVKPDVSGKLEIE